MYIGSLPLAFAFSVLLAIWQYAMLACWKHNARIIYWQAKLPFCHIAGNTAKNHSSGIQHRVGRCFVPEIKIFGTKTPCNKNNALRVPEMSARIRA
jgi:hypothetical protein